LPLDTPRAYYARGRASSAHVAQLAGDGYTPGADYRETPSQEITRRGNVIAGKPQRCIDIIRRWRDVLGHTLVSRTFYVGGMPQAMALRNIRRFAAAGDACFCRS
jgi:alkanesulfonate monooxygenase SsuD/methylene tetrahydromethanopterin reductase-like flavin-dependent oxidoreductase (luciferase family)